MWRRRVSSTEEKYLWISPLAFLREQGDVVAALIHVFDDHEIKPYLVGYSLREQEIQARFNITSSRLPQELRWGAHLE